MREFKGLHSETVNAVDVILANRFVTFGDTQADTLGEKVLGSSMYDAEIGDDLAVCTHGVAAVESGGAFVRGDDITTDAQGRAVKITTPATDYKIGEALTASAGPGFFPQILLVR